MGEILNVSAPAAIALEVRDLLCERGPVTLRAKRAAFAPGMLHLLRGDEDSGHHLLLRVLGLLEAPDAGELWVEGNPVRELDEEARRKLRERRIGFVFTAPFLLPAFTVIENVAMPLFKISAVTPAEARQRSEALLDFTGVLDVAQIPCGELLPFTQQRVALARALVNGPAAVLVEALDGALTGEELQIFATLLRKAAAQFGVAAIATTSRNFAPEPGDRALEAEGGTVVSLDEAQT